MKVRNKEGVLWINLWFGYEIHAWYGAGWRNNEDIFGIKWFFGAKKERELHKDLEEVKMGILTFQNFITITLFRIEICFTRV